MAYLGWTKTAGFKAWEATKAVGRGTKAVGSHAWNHGGKYAGGAMVATTIPLSASKSTEKDIERMKQNEPDR